MIKFEKFFAKEAWVIYIAIFILSIIGIQIFEEESSFNKVSLIVNIITVIAFLITINQIFSIKEIEENNMNLLNAKLRNYFKLMIMQDISSKLHVIDTTQSMINEDNWKNCIDGMREILKIVDILESANDINSLQIDPRVIIDFRLKFTIHAESIDKKIQYTTTKITKSNINADIRSFGSLVNKQLLKFKTQSS